VYAHITKLTGKMSELNDLIRIQDIADKAGTSIGTVDRVIHNRPGVAEKTRQRILEILKEYNYKPNLIARRLANKKIFKIAVLLPLPSNPFWKIHPEGIKKASDELKPFGVDVETFTFEFNSREEYADHIKIIKSEEYDAILTVPVYEEIITLIKETGIACIFFDTNLETDDITTHYIGENAYQTGIVGGKLLSTGIQPGDSLLIVDIGNKSNNHLLWVNREVGLQDYFINNKSSDSPVEKPNIIKIELPELEDTVVEEIIATVFKENPGITRVFINSCRATSLCAPSLEKEKQKLQNLKIVGYDLTDENILYLKKGVIDYLLNKHPREQCYHGLKMLYEFLVLRIPIPEKTYMPIDIIIKENVDYYKMLQVNQ
jgi:LacI family transcriptional regulator